MKRERVDLIYRNFKVFKNGNVNNMNNSLKKIMNQLLFLRGGTIPGGKIVGVGYHPRRENLEEIGRKLWVFPAVGNFSTVTKKYNTYFI